jgi:two-component system phosphate regulon sensor histidine kinase PhoR
MCAQKAADKQVRLELDCPDDLQAEINAPLLEQAVTNLIDNAIKYSEAGAVVRLAAVRDSNEVIVRVEDHGCGIEAVHLPRLFERFYRVDRARSRELGGTGLGLAIVKHIVAAHRGTVTVESALGRGSTFFLHLPAGR